MKIVAELACTGIEAIEASIVGPNPEVSTVVFVDGDDVVAKEPGEAIFWRDLADGPFRA